MPGSRVRLRLMCLGVFAAFLPAAPLPHPAAPATDARAVQYHLFTVQLAAARAQFLVGAVELHPRRRKSRAIPLGNFDAQAARPLCMPHLETLAALSTTPCFRLSSGDTLSYATLVVVDAAPMPEAPGAADSGAADSVLFIVELVDAGGGACRAIDTARACSMDAAPRRCGRNSSSSERLRRRLHVACGGDAPSGRAALRVRTVLAGRDVTTPVCRRDTLIAAAVSRPRLHPSATIDSFARYRQE